MRPLRVPLVVLGLLAATPAGAAAAVQTETAASGPVTATLSYDRSGSEGSDDLDTFANLSVTITRSGTQAYQGSANVGACADDTELSCHPANRLTRFDDRQSIEARDLDGDGEPEVVVSLKTGGDPEGCMTLAYRYDGSGYEREDADFGAFCARQRAFGNRTIFVSRMNGFPARWTYGDAEPAAPLRVLGFTETGFADRTTKHPRLLDEDGDDLYETYLERRRGKDRALGVLAAWAADQYLQGRRKAALIELKRLNRNNWLTAKKGARGKVPQGRAFIRSIDAYGRRSLR